MEITDLNKAACFECSTNRIKSIDTLKGLIILAIVLFHLPGEIRIYYPFVNFFYKFGGVIGNTFFFVCSGYFAAYNYCSSNTIQKYSLFGFLKKRIGTVYISYLVTSLISAVFVARDAGISVINGKALLQNIFLMTSGWVEDVYPFNLPCWFFSALIIQYILFFLVTRYKNKYSDIIYCILILTGLSILQKPVGPFLWHHTGEAMAPFFWGCFIERSKTRHGTACMRKLCIVMIIGTFYAAFHAMYTGYDMTTLDGWYVWVFIVSTAILLVVLCFEQVQKILEIRAIYTLFGNISTQIFLWHYPFNFLFLHTLGHVFKHKHIPIFCTYFVILMLWVKLYKALEDKIRRTIILNSLHRL